MKKYLLGLMAVVFAISMSAFTTPKKANIENGKVPANLYWYAVDYSTGSPLILAGTINYFGTGVTKTQAAADSQDNCSGTTKDCLRGFASEQTFTSDGNPSGLEHTSRS